MKECIGRLALTFRKKASGKTYLAKQYFKLPLQIMTPYYQDRDGTAFVYLLNPSGGVLQHDRLFTEIELEANSRALIATPSSTKFYRMDDGHAEIENSFRVGEGAVLEYLPEYNVPFADSETYQNNCFYLQKSSVLIASEILTSGRVSRGEAFGYRRYSAKTKIYVEGRLAAYDCSIIEPEKIKKDCLGMLEGCNVNGTMYIYSEKLDGELMAELKSEAGAYPAVRMGVSRIESGLAVVRALGQGAAEVQEALHGMWNVARKSILNKESVRLRKF